MQTAFPVVSPRLPCPLPATPHRRLSRLAVQALVEEATLTPKPGLVDGRGSGAHHDLSLPLLLRSAHVLEPHFAAMERAAEEMAFGVALRESLGALGRHTERAMLAATGGINTHRGAIWSLGLLVAAATLRPGADADAICHVAGTLAALPDRHAPVSSSHGEQARRRFGATGARGEAAAGFPHIRLHALPALRRARASGLSEPNSRIHALLALVAVVPDTCLLHRGGVPALAAAQHGASRTLALGGLLTASGRSAFAELDQTLLRLWASPGGSADLLAATLFLDRIASTTSRFCGEAP